MALETDREIINFSTLRTFMILFVVMAHSALVYENSGFASFFWIVADSGKSSLPGITAIVIDLFAIPVLFFISGYYSPVSLQSRSFRSYLLTRSKRLLVPWVVSVLTLLPVYKTIYLASRGLPRENLSSYLFWNNGPISQSWLWFLPVLFLFSILYPLLHKFIKAVSANIRAVYIILFLIAVMVSSAVFSAGLSGWTKSFFLEFQNERLITYLLSYLAGALYYFSASERKYRHASLGTILLLILTAASVTVYTGLLRHSIIFPGTALISPSADLYVRIISEIMSISLFMILGSEYGQDKKQTGTILRNLSDNSYGIYLIHVPILGITAMMLRRTGMPSEFLFLLLFTTVTLLSTFSIMALKAISSYVIKVKKGSS